MSSHHEPFMARAVQMARRGMGLTAPNPSVGAVIVREGVILGEGHTRPAGGLHAERVAIRHARERGLETRGATLYTTLEPCRHHGRTPPCTDAILEAGIEHVVVGVLDPFPEMQGQSIALLMAAGVEVELGVLGAECARLVRGFTRALTHGLPEVSCKVAMSLDGHIATATGESQWITSPEARRHGHQLRQAHDAIVVGIGTVLADDPRLTCRIADGAHPVPVVLDSNLRTPPDSRLLSGPCEAIIICAEDAPDVMLDAQIIPVPRTPEGIDIEVALRALAERGLHRVLVEGGGGVHRSLLASRLVDTLHAYVAGLVLPGGRPWVAGPDVTSLADGIRLEGPPRAQVVGPDVLLSWDLHHRLHEDE